MCVGTGVCKIFEFDKEWTCRPSALGSAMIRCSSFGLRMYNNSTTNGAEQSEPAMINSPSTGPKSPSRSPSRNPAAINTTNCASTQRRMTIPSIRPTLDHLDSLCRWDVDEASVPCIAYQRNWTYMNNRERVPLSSPISLHGNSSRLRALIIAGSTLIAATNKRSLTSKQFFKKEIALD